MTLYDLAIAGADEQDLPSGHKRKKEGDIIAIRPHSETVKLGGWGTSEVLNHLIVQIEMTDEEAAILQSTHREDGTNIFLPPPIGVKTRQNNMSVSENDIIKIDDSYYRALNSGNLESSFVHLDGMKQKDMKFMDGTVELEYRGKDNAQILAKRRYKIPLDIIKKGWKKDLDLDKVRDVNLNYQPLVEENIIIDSSEKVSLCFDKHKNSFKYKKVKE
jgi:hypothetical protein